MVLSAYPAYPLLSVGELCGGDGCGRCLGFLVRRQVRLPVYYKGVLLDAHFVADLVINDSHLVELKAVSNLAKIHERQVESYLKSTGMESGLLVNFGNLRRLEWRAVQ